MSGRFAGRVALVTAAAGDGIGRATATRLAAEGASVAVTDAHEARTADTTAALRAEFGERVVGHAMDVSDRERVDQVLARVGAELGPVDVLVNNAALNILAPVSRYTLEDWERVIDVDLTSCFYLIRQLLPGMMERGWGSIVNVTSVAAYLTGGGREGPYASAKAALHALTRAVAEEGGPHGVRCNAVAPGVIESRFVTRYRETMEPLVARTPLRRIGRAEEVASIIAFLVSEESSFVTGEVVNASGGWYMRA